MISAQGLTKYYGDKCAVQDLTFGIDSGEIVGLLGLNGAGKTTTLRMLACLLLPSTGTVRINGLDVVENPHEIRKLVGFLPETPPLYEEMTVESFLRFAAQLRGVSAEKTAGRIESTLDAVHIKDVRHEVISTLSHGYRQRVGIAQAIIHEPPVLILDEPIKGLDPVQIVEMRELVRSLKGKHTVLLSSHILSEISRTCDRIFVVQEGRLVATGTESELTQQLSGANRLRLAVRGPANEIVSYVGSLPKVTSCQAATAETEIRFGANSGIVQLDVATEEDIRETLSRSLVQKGYGLLEIARATGELESAFLRLSRTSSNTTEDANETATGQPAQKENN